MSVCSCAGRGVDCNQCRIADMWLEDAADYHVRVVPSKHGERTTPQWVRQPAPPGALVHGQALLEDGVPSLMLEWDTKHPALSVSELARRMNQIDGACASDTHVLTAVVV